MEKTVSAISGVLGLGWCTTDWQGNNGLSAPVLTRLVVLARVNTLSFVHFQFFSQADFDVNKVCRAQCCELKLQAESEYDT